jgi:hypothetical protein
MKNDQQEAYERVLTSSLARVVDFLKFAEAKNAALLTFSSAWILGSINLLKDPTLATIFRTAFHVALPLFVVGAIASVLSFLPKTWLAHFHKDPEQKKALLYFGDAASFATSSYRDRIRERYYPPEGLTSTENYLDDLAIQVCVNSQITVRKLKFFNFGGVVVLVALGVVGASAIWQGVYLFGIDTNGH